MTLLSFGLMVYNLVCTPNLSKTKCSFKLYQKSQITEKKFNKFNSMCFQLLGLSFCQSFNNDRFASTSRTNHHGSVTRHHCLIQLHHLVRLYMEIGKIINDTFCIMLYILLILSICLLYCTVSMSI